MAQPALALKERAYTALKRRIVTCQLLPGQVLSEQALAEELGMSRTPVREALAQLTQEALVRLAPRRGVFVTELSFRDVDEVFELREALETWVVNKVAGLVPQERLDWFENTFRAADLNYDQELEVDNDFHWFLVSLAGNRRFEAVYHHVQDQNQRIRVLSTRQPGRMAATQVEHLAILKALRDRDGAAAAEAMSAHIRNSRLAALQVL
ncbi:MAG: GntR family transcriptional regulator [Methanocella sp.]